MNGHIRTLGVVAVAVMVALSGGVAAAAFAAPTTTERTATQPAATSLQEAENASVTFEDQTTSNATVTVQNVTLPEGGYVAVHATSGPNNETAGDVVGVSDYLEPGTHENVTVTLYDDVPGAEFENTTVNGTQTFVAMAHQETGNPGQAGQPTTMPGDNATTTPDETTTTPAGNATTTAPGDNATTTPGGTTTTTPTDTPASDNASNTFHFLTADGEVDGPYLADGEPVTDTAEVSFEGGEMQPGTQDGGLTVGNLTAPAYVTPGSNVTVNATVTNEGSEELEQDVAFRIAGGDVDVVVHQNVTVGAGETTNVTFDVDTADVPEGEYTHGVTTEDSSAFARITVTNDSAVTFADQNATSNVTVEDVFVPEGGYVTIHDSSVLNAPVESVVGVSDYLEPGYHENVTVTLYDDVEGADFQNDSVSSAQTFVAMTHLETSTSATDGNATNTYDFVTSDGEEDGPYRVDGQPVVDAAIVMPDGNQTTTTQMVGSAASTIES
jgi:hypothetical protein